MINAPRRNDDAIDAVIVEECSPVGQWSKSGKNEIKLVPNESHGTIDLGEIKVGKIEKDGSVTIQNGELVVENNEGSVTFVGNNVNGKSTGAKNILRLKQNSGHIVTTVDTHISNNRGTLRATPNQTTDFVIMANTEAPDKRIAASVSVRIVSGKKTTADTKVTSILEGEPKNEGLRIYYQDTSIDMNDGNEIFVDINPDDTITLRQGSESISGSETTTITSVLEKLNVVARPTLGLKGVVLTCGEQEVQIDAEAGRIKDVFVRQR